MSDAGQKFLVRYSGGFALRFAGALKVQTVADGEATQFNSEGEASDAITAAKLRKSTVEIEPIGKESSYVS